VSNFQPLSAYQQPLVDGYRLLPFRFTSLNDREYVLTNQAGEFIVLVSGRRWKRWYGTSFLPRVGSMMI
jgi:hypothetical protein